MSQTKESKDPKTAGGDKKPRVFKLAAELNLETKTVLEFCKELGFTAITNQLNALDPDQVEALRERAKKGVSKPTSPLPAKPVAPPRPDAGKVQSLVGKPKTLPPAKPVTHAPVAPAHPVVETVPHGPTAPVAPTPEPKVDIVAEAPPIAVEPETPAPVAEMPVATPEEPVASEVVAEEPEAPVAPVVPPPGSGRVPNLTGRPANLTTRPQTLSGRAPQVLPPRPTPPPPSGAGQVRPPATSQPPASTNPAPARPAQPTPPRQTTPPNPPPAGPRPQQPGTGNPQRPGGAPRQGGPGSGPPQRAGGLPPRGQQSGGGARGPGGPGGPGKPGGPIPPKPNAAAPNPSQKQVKLTPEQIDRLRNLERQRGKMTFDQVHKQITATPPPGEAGKPGSPPPAGPARPRPGFAKPEGEEGGSDDDKKKGPGAPGAVAGRDARHKARQDKGRSRGPSTDRGSVVIGKDGHVETIEQASGSRRGPRAALLRKAMRRKQDQTIKKEGKIEIGLPVTVRTLSETIGMKAGELILKLKNLTNSLYTINSNLEFDTAFEIALDKGIELVAKKQETTEDIAIRKLREKSEASDPANVTTRPPIVTIMGHVDHGKTSLLDKIRQTYGHTSDVVSTEAGGITQVLRAWRVEKDGKATTFLDTPGHEAFTKMRARGANVTDIVVIVVSASDGVMPQTEEAIAHALAADVDVVVAINKVDLPDANIDKTRRQLYQLNLLPDNMGGEVPFVECSAKTGVGIDELLDSIATLAELSEPPLQADPTLAGSGTCLEAYLEGEKGVIATLLVQNGTLSKGNIVLCGSTFGRVRAMYDDLGRPITEAGPSVPVKVIGLDEVPDADDPFFVVDDLASAREIAEQRRGTKQAAALAKFSPVSLDKLKESHAKIKITELKIILKAEARGSVEAIRKELEKLVHEEVRVRVLHTGIGAISESDVTLALTSPLDTMIVGFNVTADDPGLKMAEQYGISLREYQIIYNLVDDVKAALEGRLKPVEEVVHLGRAVVRETFKISKVGTIAGCHVTSGIIERSSKVRVIRDGTVLFPPAEKTASLDNLKRFKDDVKEVREGFECGMKIKDFNDIKVGDVIEAYRIEIRQRTL